MVEVNTSLMNWKDLSDTTALGAQWMASPGPKTDRDNLSRYCPKTFKMVRERKKGGAARVKLRASGFWLKPPALCH